MPDCTTCGAAAASGRGARPHLCPLCNLRARRAAGQKRVRQLRRDRGDCIRCGRPTDAAHATCAECRAATTRKGGA